MIEIEHTEPVEVHVRYLDTIVLPEVKAIETVRQGVAPTEVDPEVPLLELQVIVREIALEVMLIEVQALEAISLIEVRHPEQVAIAPREAEVQVQGVVEATAPEVATEALEEATEAPGDHTDLQVVVGLREVVDLQVEAEEVEEIKPI